MTFEEEERYILDEIRTAVVTIVTLAIWIWTLYMSNMNPLQFPALVFTIVLVILGIIWIGIAFKRRKITTGSIRKVK